MLRHGSLRDDRRRRSLVEDAAVPEEGGTAAKPRRASKASETYTELARSDCHARWSDFVPLRNWMVAALLSVGPITVAALEAAYYFASQSDLWAVGGLGALDLARPDSLAGWLMAFVMFATAVVSLFVYSVRRYRLDDYRGRYRVWLWGAGLWLVMSIDTVADLRGAVRAMGTELSGQAGPADGVAWWLVPWSLAIAWIGLRMVLDARACRTATAALTLGFVVLTAALVLPQARLPIAESQLVMLAVGCSLLGRWLLFFAHAAFARHVLLDAHGQLPVRVARPKPEKKKKAESTADDAAKPSSKIGATGAKVRDDLTSRIDPPHTSTYRPATSGIDLQRASSQNGQAKPTASPAKVGVGAPAATRTAMPTAQPAKAAANFVNRYDDEDDRSEQPNKLSRAERKRMRKQQRAERHDDE